MTPKYKLRIPGNLQICIDAQKNKDGLIVKLNDSLWMIIRKNATTGEYGHQLLNPNNDEKSDYVWGLTKEQCTRLINKLIKNPVYSYG